MEKKLENNTVQQTLCIPLWGRMLAERSHPDLFPDPDAKRIIKKMGVNLKKSVLYQFEYASLNCAIRQYDLAWEINHYLKKHKNAIIVELGAGLSTLRRQMKNTKNDWYNLDMENVIALREQYIKKGKKEHNISCNLLDTSWFKQIPFRKEEGIVFVGGGLFYYFEREQVKRLFTAMAEQFPGGMVAFDATNAKGIKGVNKEVSLAGNHTKSYFSLEDPKKELEGWSEKIVHVSEKEYMTGYIGKRLKVTPLTKVAIWVCKKCHLSFIVHMEFGFN